MSEGGREGRSECERERKGRREEERVGEGVHTKLHM